MKKRKKVIRVREVREKKISENLAILCLILNIILFPGLGSLIGGKIKQGLWQIALILIGVVFGILFIILGSIISFLIGLLLMIVLPITSWVWAMFTGIELIKTSQK